MSTPDFPAEALLQRLDHLLMRLDQLEARLSQIEARFEELPGVFATAVNTLDQISEPLRLEGAVWPERLPILLKLLEQLTQPDVLECLEHLSARKDQFLPWLNVLADLPAMVCTAVDTLDAETATLKRAGIDLSERLEPILRLLLEISKPENISALQALSQLLPVLGQDAMLAALQNLTQHLDQWIPLLKMLADIPGMISTGVNSLDAFYQANRQDMDKLLERMQHGILDMRTLVILASAAEALALSQKDYQPSSLFQALKLLATPELKHVMGFFLSFMRYFSHSLQASNLPNSQ